MTVLFAQRFEMGAVLPTMNAREHDEISAVVAQASDICRVSRSVGDMVRLRDARVRSGQSINEETRTSWQLQVDKEPENLFDPEPGMLPELCLRDLTITNLQSAMYHHGALIIRNLFDPRLAHEYRKKIDEVFAAANELAAEVGDGAPDERPARSKGRYLPLGKKSGMSRPAHFAFLGKSGAVETFLSPKVSHELLDSFEALGLRGLLQSYFRDEACLSFQKSVLRRAEPLENPAEWHQDGAFMTPGIQSLNLWISLTECGAGTEAPGMDLIPRRLSSILPTGTNNAVFNWSVSGKTVAEEFPELEPARPYFGAGDAVFFDHYNLHATSSGPEFTQPRYAIETWFFSKSKCAINQTPVIW
ncbi:MAG: hypothetical protein AAGC81_01080 [Pseudomonadota bacterium]